MLFFEPPSIFASGSVIIQSPVPIWLVGLVVIFLIIAAIVFRR